MFVYNFKMNGSRCIRTVIALIIIFSILILLASFFYLYNKTQFVSDTNISSNSISNIDSNQYTNILKEVYENIDKYIGNEINFTGYIYKVDGLKDNQFILARNMLINSDSQSVVVGFLCSSDDTYKFSEGCWVNVTGTIIKGYYHDEIPVIDINKIEIAEKPENEFVYPPDGIYIPTSSIQ